MNFNGAPNKRIDETTEYKSFSEGFEFTANFINDLADHIHFNGHVISFFSGHEIYTLNSNLLESSAKTLKSIKLCCSIGSFSDANTLLRKLRDDLILYNYILSIINTRNPFIEENVNNLNIGGPEEFIDSLSKVQFNTILTDDELAITAWLRNNVAELPRSHRRKLEFENYMKVLRNNTKIEKILSDYSLEKYWEKLRKNLNDYVHNNDKSFSAHNFVSAYDKNLDIHFKNINHRASHICSFFLVTLLMIESSLISSTDYVDHLDSNLEPPTDSQYWVAPFIQEFIDKKISVIHPELKQYLKDNNVHGMKID